MSESGYHGKFTEKSDCAKIASVTPGSGKGPVLKVKVTPLRTGSCAIVFTDEHHAKATLRVTDRKIAGHLKFSVLVPVKIAAQKRRAKSKVGPKYISPSAQAMTVAISGPTGVTIVSGLAELSSICTVTLSGLACTFDTALSPCPSSSDCYTATVTTYDAYDPPSNTVPAGANALSVAKQSFSIAGGNTSAIELAFSGIPAQITIVPNTPFVTQNSNTVTLVGPEAHAFVAEALDADRNLIAGSGAPLFTVGSSGSLGVTVRQPPEGSPVFSMIPPAIPDISKISTVTVNASFSSGPVDGCAQPGASCVTSFVVSATPLIACPCTIAGSIGYYTFSPIGNGLGTPLLTVADGIDNAAAAVFDASNNLYVANAGNDTVTQYPLGATTPSETISDGVSSPGGLELDPSGNLFVMNGNKTITGYKPGANKPFVTQFVVAGMQSFAVGAADDLWVLVPAPYASGYLPGGSVTLYPGNGSVAKTLSGYSAPIGVAIDSAGWLYVADGIQTGCGVGGPCGQIWAYAPGTASNPRLAYNGGACGANSLFQGPDGNVYNTIGCEFANGKLLLPGGGGGVPLSAPGTISICLTPAPQLVLFACAE